MIPGIAIERPSMCVHLPPGPSVAPDAHGSCRAQGWSPGQSDPCHATARFDQGGDTGTRTPCRLPRAVRGGPASVTVGRVQDSQTVRLGFGASNLLLPHHGEASRCAATMRLPDERASMRSTGATGRVLARYQTGPAALPARIRPRLLPAGTEFCPSPPPEHLEGSRPVTEDRVRAHRGEAPGRFFGGQSVIR
jgi:hypothetical protein